MTREAWRPIPPATVCTRTSASVLIWVVLSCVLLLAVACRKSGHAVARLESMAGQVDRDHAAKVGAFTGARIGDEFFIGDAIRTGRGSGASLVLLEQNRLALEESSLVRFLQPASGKQAPRIDLELGQAVLIAGDQPMSLETSFGVALIEPKAKLRITRSAAGAVFEVAFGAAVLELKGQRKELKTGSKLEVSIELAIIEPAAKDRTTTPPGSASAEPPLPPGAITVEVEGDGAQVRGPAQSRFEPLPRGTAVVLPGSTLRMPARTSALLHAPEGDVKLSGAGEFSIRGSSDALVRTEYGNVDLGSTGGPVTVRVPGGAIRLAQGARALLHTQKTGTKVAVGTGSATLQGSKGSENLGAGEQAVLERDGTIHRSRDRGLDHSDMVAAIGESFVVHDPRPPSAVGFTVGSKCEAAAVLEMGGKELLGEKTISALLKPGKHSYALRCLTADDRESEVVARGWVAVMADAGTRRLPSTAPVSTIDADGRQYTVLFQNQLPAVTVRWRKASGAGPFTLQVRPVRGSPYNITTSQPQYTFAAGKIGEGAYDLIFEGAGSRTPPTRLDIHFDDATPAASITSPTDGGFTPGASVQVAGTALPGSRVSIGGTELAQDEQHRFSGAVSAPSTERALTIRFTHSQRGTHYYLRRSQGGGK